MAFITRTGTSTYTEGTIIAGSSKVIITNGDGIAGNPAVDVDESNIELSDLAGTLGISKGGTSATSALDAFNNLSPLTTKGDIISNDGTNNVRAGVGSDDQVLTSDSSSANGISWKTINSPSATDIQVFTSTGASTWTKPAGAKSVDVYIMAAGGGGSGGNKASSTPGAYPGACGAGSGGASYSSYPASILGSTEIVTVGAGGAGGIGATYGPSAGSPGTNGISSSFGQWLVAFGGQGGLNSPGAAGAGIWPGNAGGNQGLTPTSSMNSLSAGAGGGAGGYDIYGNPTLSGSGSNGSILRNTQLVGGAAGVSGASTTGQPGSSASTNEFCGGAGGGAGSTIIDTTSNIDGGDGGLYGGGGGAGGTSRPSSGMSGGKGGNGGQGIVIVITYF